MKEALKYMAVPAVVVGGILMLIRFILMAFTIEELIFPAMFLAAVTGFVLWDNMTRAELSSIAEQEKQQAAEAIAEAQKKMAEESEVIARERANRIIFAQNIDAFDNYFGDRIGNGGW